MRIIKWLRLYPAVDGELGRGGGAMCLPCSYGPGGKLGLFEAMTEVFCKPPGQYRRQMVIRCWNSFLLKTS